MIVFCAQSRQKSEQKHTTKDFVWFHNHGQQPVQNFGVNIKCLLCSGRNEHFPGDGLMASVLVLGSSSPGLSPSRGHCVVFLGKTLNSHSASLHPGV